MRKVTLAVLAVAVASAVAAATAGARTGIQVPSSPPIDFVFRQMEFDIGLGIDVICEVTIEATYHERIPKTAGSLMGYSYWTIGTCQGGLARLLVGVVKAQNAGSYHRRHTGYSGTLPSVTSVIARESDVSFWIEAESYECLSDPVDVSVTTTGGNPATGVTLTASSIPLEGEFLCGFASGEISGTGTLSSSLEITLY